MIVAAVRALLGQLGICVFCLIAASCDFPRRPELIEVSGPQFKPSKPSDVKTPEQAMATVMAVCRDDLRLPEVEQIQLFLYKNHASMAHYGRGWRTLPIDVENLAASTAGNKIHVNLGGREPARWASLIRLLAHEYGHSIEARLQSRNRYLWFTEGFATWVSAKALHALGWEDYRVALERARYEVVHGGPLPDWNELSWQWKHLLQARKGFVKTYVLAFIVVDRLISRAGVEAVLKFIETGDFEKSFQFSWGDFESEFDSYLSELSRLQQTQGDNQVIFNRPNWSAGDEWTYKSSSGGDESVSVVRVLREGHAKGTAAYFFSIDDVEVSVSKETPSQVHAPGQRNGSAEIHHFENLAWPLAVGKQWAGTYRYQNAMGQRRNINVRMTVADAKDVTVPAGTFHAARIQAYNSNSGRLAMEYWYASAAKNVIKLLAYNESPYRQKELVRFRVSDK